jgi:hypothetical protein
MSFEIIPHEVNHIICQKLDGPAFANMTMTCTYWNGLCVEIETDDKDLWRRFLADYFPRYRIEDVIIQTIYGPCKTQSVSYKKQFESQFKLIARYPKTLAAVFGGRQALAKFPVETSGMTMTDPVMMTGPVIRTAKYYQIYNKNLIGLELWIKDLIKEQLGTVELQANSDNTTWDAFAEELDANPFAEGPEYSAEPVFSIDIDAAAQKIENMLNGTDPHFKIV